MGAIALVVVLAVIAIGVFFITRGGDEAGDGTPVAGNTSTTGSGSILGMQTPSTEASDASTPTTDATQVTGNNPTNTAPGATTAPEQPTEADDTAEPTDDTEPAGEEEVPTEEPTDAEPDPTETPALADVPEAPADGDFGPLPPVQITSGGLTRNLELTYALNADLAAVPSSGTVYQLSWAALDEDTAAAVVAAVLPDATLTEQGSGWHAEGSGGSISLQADSVQYVGASPEPGDLPEDSSAISAANDWLLASGLVGNNVGDAFVIARDADFGRVVVQVKPAEPAPVLAFLPSATVTIGPGGAVVEANVRWPSDMTPAEYTLRDPNAVWNDVLAGRGSIEADLSQLSNSGALSAEIGVNEVTLAWSYASGENGDFLVPVIAMHGTLTMLETGEQIPASIYLTAVTADDTAQG